LRRESRGRGGACGAGSARSSLTDGVCDPAWKSRKCFYPGAAPQLRAKSRHCSAHGCDWAKVQHHTTRRALDADSDFDQAQAHRTHRRALLRAAPSSDTDRGSLRSSTSALLARSFWIDSGSEAPRSAAVGVRFLERPGTARIGAASGAGVPRDQPIEGGDAIRVTLASQCRQNSGHSREQQGPMGSA